MDILKKTSTCSNQMGSLQKAKKTWYVKEQASQSRNIRFDEMVKLFRFVENMDELYVHKKIQGKAVDFWFLM